MKWYMSAYRFPFVDRPFKGAIAYEVQVLDAVIQWHYESTGSLKLRNLLTAAPSLRWGHLCMWTDTAWWPTVTWPWRWRKRLKKARKFRGY
jgi:hypothetical protein